MNRETVNKFLELEKELKELNSAIDWLGYTKVKQCKGISTYPMLIGVKKQIFIARKAVGALEQRTFEINMELQKAIIDTLVEYRDKLEKELSELK